jgi:hypothetical protein
MLAEKRDFELACVAMLGALEGLRRAAARDGQVGALPPRSIEIRTQNLQRDVEALYEHVVQGSVADDAEAELMLLRAGLRAAPLRAEDFDHFPPFRGKPQ